MKPGFEQTTDLVRFRVRATSRDTTGQLRDFGADERRSGRPWFVFNDEWSPRGGLYALDFFCSREVAPKVLDILERHGIERTESLG